MTSWIFDGAVADVFDSYAPKHIPNYHQIIQQSAVIVDQLCGRDAHVVDVGCATGATLRYLKQAGFNNLHGVDNSEAMIGRIDPTIATLHVSDSFPVGLTFDAVIANWTLHFIHKKEQYIDSILSSIRPGGVLILTDKTSIAPIPTKFYYDFKRSMGVTDEEIEQKEIALRGVMRVDSVEWYLNYFKPRVDSVHIFNAAFCFTSFLIVK